MQSVKWSAESREKHCCETPRAEKVRHARLLLGCEYACVAGRLVRARGLAVAAHLRAAAASSAGTLAMARTPTGSFFSVGCYELG